MQVPTQKRIINPWEDGAFCTKNKLVKFYNYSAIYITKCWGIGL